jgi:hypothetical protein
MNAEEKILDEIGKLALKSISSIVLASEEDYGRPLTNIRCQPWKAKRGLVVRDRRR